MSVPSKEMVFTEDAKAEFLSSPHESGLLFDPFRWDMQRGPIAKRKAEVLRPTYAVLEPLHVTQQDAIRLYADLRFGGDWGERSAPILDGLLTANLQRLETRMANTDYKDYEYIRLSGEHQDLQKYFHTPPSERMHLVQKDGLLSTKAYKELEDYVINYLNPLTEPIPDETVTVFDHYIHNPSEVLLALQSSMVTGKYGEGIDSRDSENYGIQQARSLKRELAEYQDVSDENILLPYPIKVVPLDRLHSWDASYGGYVEQMANGVIHSAEDPIYLANYGTLLLTDVELLAKRLTPAQIQDRLTAARIAFSLSEQLGKELFVSQEGRLIHEQIQPRAAEANLRLALQQLYNHEKATETEEALGTALTVFKEYLTKHPKDANTARLYAWTLYHTGIFYQDVAYDIGKANTYFSQLITETGETSDISDQARGRIERGTGRMRIDTTDGTKDVPLDEHLRLLTAIETTTQEALLRHYQEEGLQYITVPQIVGITGACENIDTLIKAISRAGVPLFITQTGQLALEQSLQVHRNGVVTVITSGRDELTEDKRHLRQFRLTEEEFASTYVGMTRENYDEETMFEALLQHIEGATKSMIDLAVKQHGGELSPFYGRDITQLEEALANPYLRLSYDQAVTLLRDNGFPELRWGADLDADHEQMIIRLANSSYRDKLGDSAPKTDLPTFITRYPKDIKFFNMKVSEQDPRVVLSADLILPIAGEAAGSAVREHDGKKLEDRLLGSNLFRLHTERGGTIHDFKWYLDIINQQRTEPHAGYGIGNARVMQYILGQSDIRKCSGMRIMAEQAKDWDRKTGITVPA